MTKPCHLSDCNSNHFQVKKNFPLPVDVFPAVAEAKPSPDLAVHIELEVALGVIQDVRIQLPLDHFDPDLDLTEAMHGLAFGKDVVRAVYEVLQMQPMSEGKKAFIYDCVSQMVGKFV